VKECSYKNNDIANKATIIHSDKIDAKNEIIFSQTKPQVFI